LLRSDREWPRRRSTQCRDEIAPSHLTRLKKVSYAFSNATATSNVQRGTNGICQFKTLAKSMSELGHQLTFGRF
jgi:hypothetical protein